MSKGELMTVAYAEDLATRDDKIDSDEATHCARTLVAVYALLGAAARGELPRCRWRQWCGALATKRLGGEGDGFAVCDGCFGSREHEPNDTHWHDLPHAAALRAAMGKGGAT